MRKNRNSLHQNKNIDEQDRDRSFKKDSISSGRKGETNTREQRDESDEKIRRSTGL